MKHGDKVYLKRRSRRYLVEVVSDHTATFPAVTVKRGQDEWIVGINELVTTEQIQMEEHTKHLQDLDSVQDIVNAYNLGYQTFGSIARFLNIQQVKILSRCRKAERMGLIKLKRERPRHGFTPKPSETQPHPGQSTESVPSLRQDKLVPDRESVDPVHENGEPESQDPGRRTDRVFTPQERSGDDPATTTGTTQAGD